MGVIGGMIGAAPAVAAIGAAVRDVAGAFSPHATRAMELSAGAQQAALAQHAAEFGLARGGWFDGVVNGLNRLPRPLLALSTIGLFAYAMADPPGFARRMVALAQVPEPLWWLLGGIVSFYFGAREAFYFRRRQTVAAAAAPPPFEPEPEDDEDRPVKVKGTNPALNAWQQSGGMP
ncbi:holin family protein [Ruixingdingia sedimenti]|uniref:Holin family protein n=1 Tax=Ruixingdingia sedimenti TaxID=3073604 RepID=A0ABU1F4R6_9RHOB|nr:holin family protein [Xinfangfangia sp. LG-4]MDR5651870.1 holin family protein [Xinfangfangia sp. LG-4]